MDRTATDASVTPGPNGTAMASRTLPAPTPVAATPATAHVQPPLVEQLSRPVLALATATPGNHVLTLRLSPEHLGPMTVQAHIGDDGVRIELFCTTDAGRAAVHAVLGDLRRDLAGTGLGASLDLSDRGAPMHDPSARQDGRGADARDRGSGPGRLPATAPPDALVRRPSTPPTTSSSVRLDVLV